jgi:hypothetical protein
MHQPLPLPRTLTTPLTLHVSAATGEADVSAELRYDPNDPFAVSLAIGVDVARPVVWTFARDLLITGMTAPAGEGDITIEPGAEIGTDGPQVRITLATDSIATMTASSARVVEFLVESLTEGPAGTEMDRVDVDRELDLLFA